MDQVVSAQDSEAVIIDRRSKRARDGEPDSDPDSPELKLVRVDSVDAASDLVGERPESGAGRVDSDESGANSPAAKRIQEDLLDGILDGPEDATVQGLDFVMKSLEEEILVGGPAPATEVPPERGQSPPELGYLLEASDDELGLPPAGYSGEEYAEAAGLAAVVGGFGFDDEIPSYDSFELGLVADSGFNGGEEFVALGGLFDHSDDGLGAADVSLSAL